MDTGEAQSVSRFESPMGQKRAKTKAKGQNVSKSRPHPSKAHAPAKAAAPAPVKKAAHSRQGFRTHEHIVYPAHGVGQIVRIEEQEIAGIKLELFVISFAKDKMTLGHRPLPKARKQQQCNADEKKLFSRLMEAPTGVLEYTDAQVGRIIDYLEETGQLDNTVVLYTADNGASGEGSPNGSVNENKFFNGYPDELSENLKLLDVLGGPDTYEHYPTGWAAAFSTPFKMFKRYSEYAGGTCDPLVISWPKGIKARGQVRNQYHHSTDIVATILDICGLEMPKVYKGVKQYPLSGISMRYSFDAKPDAPTKKKRQYYAMLGTRGIWENGWKAVAVHGPTSGIGHFDKDQWELYHVDEDRAESKNLAKEHPEKLQGLIKAWFEEAKKNLVLPLDDRTVVEILTTPRPTEEADRERFIYYPGTSSVPESVAANVRGRSYKILADVEIDGGLFRRDLRPRFALRRPLAVHQGQEAALRLQLPRHQAGAEVRLARAQARQVHARHGVHPGEGGPEPRIGGQDEAVCRQDGRRGRPDARAGGQVNAVRRRPVRRLRQRPTRSAPAPRRPAPFKGGTIAFRRRSTEGGDTCDLGTLAKRAARLPLTSA